MKKLPVIPCCYYPTEVVLVDDSQDILEELAYMLERHHIPARSFVSPNEALDYINAKSALMIKEMCHHSIDQSGESLYEAKMDLSKIAEQYLNPKRHEYLTVVVSDYSMPALNGVELCRKLSLPEVKKIILTGVGDSQLAVSAFNEGLIDKFILKGEVHLEEKLVAMIALLQFEYFSQQSPFIYAAYQNFLTHKPFIKEISIITWWQQFLKNHQIDEYYLMPEGGFLDYLCIKNKDQPEYYWLALRDENDLHALANIASSYGCDKTIVAPIEKRQFLPLFTSFAALDTSPDDWPGLFEPLEAIETSEKALYYVFKKLEACPLDKSSH